MKKPPRLTLYIAAALMLLFLLGSGAMAASSYNAASQAPTMPVAMPTFSFAMPTLPSITQQATVTPFPTVPTSTLPASPTFSSLSVQVITVNGTPIVVTPNPTISYVYRSPTPIVTPIVWNVPTVTPQKASTFTSATATVTSTSFPAGATCNNALYPIVAGNQWTYYVTARGRDTEIVMTALGVSGSEGIIQVYNQARGLVSETRAQCYGDVIRSFPFLSADMLLNSTDSGELTATYVSGVLAPNEAAFASSNWGLSWSSQYLLSGSGTAEFRGNLFDVSASNSPLSVGCQTLATGDAAFETITVPAGTFRALKIVCSAQGEITANVNGSMATGTASGHSIQWFALNVGLIKMQVDYASVSFFGFNVPFDASTYMELRSYTKGQ